MLEAWRRRNKTFPEEIYLQLDGGCENANKFVLGFLELLVIKRLAELILFSRLSTGHTHEDIDSCFSVIWLALRSHSCETLEKHKQMIENAFKSKSLPA